MTTTSPILCSTAPRRRAGFLSLGTWLSLAAAGAMSLSLTSCDTATGQGAGYGAAGGAILGGLIGGSTRTAAIGAAAGAATGALIGSQVDANNRDNYYYRERRNDYPFARPSGRRGTVISPYAPYYEIDVRGVPHGALVRDPSCGRIFIRP